MNLLFDEDYDLLKNSGLEYVEDFSLRFLVIKNYPLSKGLYVYSGLPIETVEVLSVIPLNYNMEGTDMLWTHPFLTRADGKEIPRTMQFGGGDPRFFEGKEYCRWSRHYPAGSWKAKEDNVQKILGRIEWALKNPDAVK
jgi:hypothetical protein